MSTPAAPSSLTTWRDILASSNLVSKRLQDALACPSLVLLHRSQWRCLASSYSTIIQALIVLLDHALSLNLEPSEQEILCRRLTGPLHALHQAVQQGDACMHKSLPSSSDSTHSWLLETALKLGMSTDVVDLHLHRLLWISSVVREQILRFAYIDDMELIISKQTRDLCEIWAHMDAEDDILSDKGALRRVMGEEEEETHQLASFILQKLSHAPEHFNRIPDSEEDLPPFLWVDPDSVERNLDAIGQGGYGKVHEAKWLRGHFAVKDFFYVENDEVFGREAIIQAHLRHPNVVPLVCCTKNPSQNNCSLVMELMERDLRAHIMQSMKNGMDQPPFPLLLAVDLMLQIAQGMEYLHSDSLRIIHRDLKSSNILVSCSNRAGSYENDVNPHVHLKVADFGMSRAKYESSKSISKQIDATAWRAPEVFEVNPNDEVVGDHPNAKYTNKADVYSFGLVCYEILTGKIPFGGTNNIQRSKVLAGKRPTLPSYCPPALSSYIERCWHTEPAERPTFIEICRILRYTKACILLQDPDNDHNATEWLSHPLSTAMCARIDAKLRSLLQKFGVNLRPQLLVIPLEMYCCRVVLQQFRDGTEIDSGNGLEESSQKAKGHYFNRTLNWLKKLSWMKSTRHANSGDTQRHAANSGDTQRHAANSELQDALGLVGGFTYEELCIATNKFSRVIGYGGSGQVYSGELADGRKIAVKVGDIHGHNGFLTQELRIASQLQHRNIVPLFGWCQDRGKLFLVYEYMANGDLGKHLFGEDGRILEWKTRYKVVCQLAAALKYLHQDSGYKEIVHRDVKTSNILLDFQWNARLGDCGIAVLLQEGEAVDNIAGTGGFLPPEALSGEAVSPASDIYGFGVTVLEIVTGRRVFFWRSEERVYVVQWVWELSQKGKLMHAADVRLAGKFDKMEMRKLLILGLECTSGAWRERPAIDQVVKLLLSREPLPPPPTLAKPVLGQLHNIYDELGLHRFYYSERT